jgi:hypothetical protein
MLRPNLTRYLALLASAQAHILPLFVVESPRLTEFHGGDGLAP